MSYDVARSLWRLTAACAMLLSILGLISGCTGIEPALAGFAADASAAVFTAGKLKAAEMSPMDDVVAALESAVDDLSLRVIKIDPEPEEGRHAMRLADEAGLKISILVQRRTATLTSVRIDVGLFGPEPVARLILDRIHHHLRPTSITATPIG